MCNITIIGAQVKEVSRPRGTIVPGTDCVET